MNREFDGRNRQDNEYTYDTSGHGDKRAGADKDKANEGGDACKDPRIQNWHPDYSLSSPQAREWHKQNEDSRHHSLKLDEGGTYTVKHGDCLSTIAARELEAEGQAVNKKSIAHEVKEIVELNHEKYNALDCNKEYLAAGWKLKLPGCKIQSQEAHEAPQPLQPQRQIPFSTEQPPNFNAAADAYPLPQQTQFPVERAPILIPPAPSPDAGYQIDYGRPQYAPGGGDRDQQQIVRVAKDLLEGQPNDAALVLRRAIEQGEAPTYIKQANQLATHAALEKGTSSPLHIAMRQDGEVAIVDRSGRSIAQVGNIYRQNENRDRRNPDFQPGQLGHPPINNPSPYSINGYNQERYSQPQQQQANHQNWRSSYGVSGGIVPTLQNRNDQIQNDMQNVTPERRWQPNAQNVRNWNDPLDDPAANQALYNLRQKNGLSSVFGDPGSGTSKTYDISKIFG